MLISYLGVKCVFHAIKKTFGGVWALKVRTHGASFIMG